MTPVRADFITNIAPHYRAPLWRRLLDDKNLDASFIFGESGRSAIKPINFKEPVWTDAGARTYSVKNVYLRGVLVWQVGVLKHVMRTDARVVVLLGQVYIVSMWLAAIVARRRGIRVVFWGHGAYGREKGIKRWSLKRFLGLADKILVYGERARKVLIEWGFRPDRVQAVYNSLDHANHLELRTTVIDSGFYARQRWFESADAPVLIFVGRLTRQKQLDLLIDSVRKLCKEGRIFNLILVGNGPERRSLQTMAVPLSDQIYFHGPCYDDEELGKLIANADLCVSPGEVGLTAIHALSFGTPVCTHDDKEAQMPEAEAINPGQTGIFFARAKMDISGAIRSWFDSRPDRLRVRRACYKVIDDKWNTGNQARIIVDAIREVDRASSAA